MTGAGKTHTMFGEIYNQRTQEEGLILHIVKSLFQRFQDQDPAKEFKVRFGYLEIYNESIIDLLVDTPAESD